MQIRSATSDDREALVDLRAALWPEASRDEHGAELGEILAGRPPGMLPLAVFVADRDGALVGFVEVGLRSHADGCDPSKPCGFLEGWYVQPACAGQGVGRALVEQAEEWARQQGCSEMASDTWVDNETSQRAHEALGFEVVDRCVNYRKTIASGLLASHHAPADFYGTDLARIHHDSFGELAEAAATEVLHRLARQAIQSGTVIDLAAGSGILSRRALDAGFDVVGVDISHDMLRLARSQAPGAQFVTGSLWEFDLPPCVAVAAVGEAFNYAAGSDNPDVVQLEKRFEAIARSLAPGGLLLFDVAGPGRSGPTAVRQIFWEKEHAAIHVEETEDRAAFRLRRRIQAYTPVGGLYRRSRELHHLVLYSPGEVEAALRRAGYAVERLDRYDTFQFLPGWCGFAATLR